MLSALLERIVPATQRRTLDEMVEDLDLSAGDSRAKRSAFWTMLTLSSVIAAGGVITDSTATVIGAMIIAPLATPIMGIALGSVQRRRTGSVRIVLFGCLLVIGVGLVFSVALPESYDLLSNGQISGRTSPGLMDLVSAVATGLAGALALSRRDVAAVLPGVAIAISLVPPLVVAGVCLGHLAFWPAMGALVLFLSNLFGLVSAGMAVFAVVGYGAGGARRATRRTRLAMALLFTVVFIPLVGNTTVTILVDLWTARAKEAAGEWLADTPGSSVTRVDMVSRTIHVHVRSSGDLPPRSELIERLDGEVPQGLPVVVQTTRGQRIDAGVVGH
ncbi:DUF389 domain-containing protein [Nocardiopsis sp. EMB25]|uniref:DUF389 domain-containing protein n=1 Tax=Nocardiopsis sp. EMB25 TaxID=2835867 RepID=UPI00228489B1|nr:DUF389 domain-containing protein [Nocardiopsis sp. EMB25]MCY9786755.1 DUF389 domain-containing protein [Nocardiopsis sp. EMB25]